MGEGKYVSLFIFSALEANFVWFGHEETVYIISQPERQDKKFFCRRSTGAHIKDGKIRRDSGERSATDVITHLHTCTRQTNYHSCRFDRTLRGVRLLVVAGNLSFPCQTLIYAADLKKVDNCAETAWPDIRLTKIWQNHDQDMDEWYLKFLYWEHYFLCPV